MEQLVVRLRLSETDLSDQKQERPVFWLHTYYSGFPGIAVSPQFEGNSSVGIVKEERMTYRTRNHGFARKRFF